MSTTAWEWSEEQGDYFCWRWNAGNQKYDLLWSRAQVPQPAPEPPRTSQSVGTNTSSIAGRHADQGRSAYTQSGASAYTPQTSAYSRAPSGQSPYSGYYGQASQSLYAGSLSGYNQGAAPGGGAGGGGGGGGDDEPGSEDEGGTDYMAIANPRGYFKKGRIFMAPDPISPRKIRRYIVVRGRATYCLCLCIHTYGGMGTAKPNVNANDHAAVVTDREGVELHAQERPLRKDPLNIILEPPTDYISPYARIDFGKIRTVEHARVDRVRTIGRIDPDYLARLESYFRTGIGINIEPTDEDE